MSSAKPAANPNREPVDGLGDLLPQPVYQALRNHFLRPHETVYVSRYFFQEWLPRLGLLRWMLVLCLRESLQRTRHAQAGEEDGGTQGVVRVTRQELAARLECSEKTVSDLLRHIPHPTHKGWRAIDPNGPDGRPDPRRQALSRFIPRLRYWYQKEPGSDAPPKRYGFIIAVTMDDPLTPEDEARLRDLRLDEIQSIVAHRSTPEGSIAPSEPPPSGTMMSTAATSLPERHTDPSGALLKGRNALSGGPPEGHFALSGSSPEGSSYLSGVSLTGEFAPSGGLKGKNDPISLTLTKLTKYIQEELDTTLTNAAQIRRALTPLVRWTEHALGDYHSTGMFYKVLCALYPHHLDLFVAAMREALEVGMADSRANLGAIFVTSLKTLAREAGVELGLANTGSPSTPHEVTDLPRAEGHLLQPEPTERSVEEEGTTEGWTAERLWQQALAELQLQMPKATFDTWLHGTRGIAWDGEQLVVQLRTAQAQAWLEARMQANIERTVGGLVGHDVRVVYRCRNTSGITGNR